MPADALAALGGARPDDEGAAARALEAYFLRRLLAEVRSDGADPMFGGGFAGATFREMLDEALADEMAAAGGVGLGPLLERELGGADAAVAPTPLASPALAAAGYRGAAAALDVRPVDGHVTSPFGARPDPIDGSPDVHTGVDIAARAGTPVRAAGAGTVVRAGLVPGYGNLVVLDHGGGVETAYAHLEGFDVRAGDRVPAGAVIGKVGATGRATGPHLHFEVRRGGKPVNPLEELPGLKDRPARPTDPAGGE
jgi:murein DD-endopeptidase MepM/ murein hydrolase activator NlpD